MQMGVSAVGARLAAQSQFGCNRQLANNNNSTAVPTILEDGAFKAKFSAIPYDEPSMKAKQRLNFQA